MKKKILILVGFVLLLCGCDVEVDLKVSKNDITETIKITDYVSSYASETMLLRSYREYIPAFASEVIVDTEPDEKKSGVEYYSKNTISINNGYNFTYDYKYEFDDYQRSTSVKSSYRSAFIQYDRKESNIVISTDSAGCILFNQYKMLNNLKINITSNYKVLETNADSVKDNVYTWNLSRSNNKNIYIKYDTSLSGGIKKEENSDLKEETKKEELEEEKNDAISPIYVILVVILAMLLFITIVIVISKIDKRKYE